MPVFTLLTGQTLKCRCFCLLSPRVSLTVEGQMFSSHISPENRENTLKLIDFNSLWVHDFLLKTGSEESFYLALCLIVHEHCRHIKSWRFFTSLTVLFLSIWLSTMTVWGSSFSCFCTPFSVSPWSLALAGCSSPPWFFIGGCLSRQVSTVRGWRKLVLEGSRALPLYRFS